MVEVRCSFPIKKILVGLLAETSQPILGVKQKKSCTSLFLKGDNKSDLVTVLEIHFYRKKNEINLIDYWKYSKKTS